MKKIFSIILALALVVSSITFSGVANVNAEATDWQTTAITVPQEGKLVGAGYIDVIFNANLENAISYQIYLDGEKYLDKDTDEEIIYEAAEGVTSIRGEVYTTGVSAHTVYVVATLKDGSTVQAETRKFYVSKKGLAMGGDMSETVVMKKMNLSWYYNWATTAFNSTVDDGVAHVPMVWGAAEDNLADIANITEDSNYVLGYNEPDIPSQANITPAQGLKFWPAVENLGKRTVSPAASNPNGASGWVTEFLYGTTDEEGNEIPGVECDAVALHCYGGGTDVDRLLSAIESMWNTYHKPIWVTEVSVTGRKGTPYDNSYENEEARKRIENYVKELVTELDKIEYVERYAWFPYNINSSNEIDGLDGCGATAMFDYETGKFTELGYIYASIGNPEGYEIEALTEDDRFIYVEPTTAPTETETTEAPTTTPSATTISPTKESQTNVVTKKPAMVKIKSAKNIKKKSVKLTWKSVANAKKYQVQYSLNRKFKTAKKYKTKTKLTTKTTLKIKKLTKKKTYYFRVRGVNGNSYGKWSKAKKVKVKK